MTEPQSDEEVWYTLDTLTFLDCDLFDAPNNVAHATMKVIEALTDNLDVVEVVYYAMGDYEDRWVDVTGKCHNIRFWRPCSEE